MTAIRKGGNKAQEIMASRALYVAYNHLGDSVRAARYKENYLNLTESAYDPAQAHTASKRLDDFEKSRMKILTIYFRTAIFS